MAQTKNAHRSFNLIYLGNKFKKIYHPKKQTYGGDKAAAISGRFRVGGIEDSNF